MEQGEKIESHPDKSLGSDYRPTRQGSTDYDRKKKQKSQNSIEEDREYRKEVTGGEETESDSSDN